MSNTSDQTTKQNDKTRLIVGEVGIDTETGIVGKGHSYDNGKTFTVDDTIYGRIYHANDHDKIWKGIQDQVAKVVDPAKSAADSAVSAADAAVASAQVTSDTVSAIASAQAEAMQGANEAMSRALSAWDVATGAKSAVTDFDPLLKSAQSDAKQANETAVSAYEQSRSAYDAVQADSSAVVTMQSSMADFREDVASAQSVADSAQSDASQALAQIADTANALGDAKTAFNSGVAEAKQLASTAQTTADSAVESAGENAKALASQANVLSDAKKAMDSGVASATGLANAAQATADNAIKSAASVASDLTAVASQAKSNASGITKVTSDVGVLQTTVADTASALNDAKTAFNSQAAEAKQLASTAQTTADNAVKSASSVASDLTAVSNQAKANASGITKVTSDVGLLQTTVADNSGNISKIQETAAQIQQAVSDNAGNITVAKQTANSAVAVASDARSNATVAIQTASQASIAAQNASGQAASAVLTASGAMTTASNAESDATVAVQTASGASLTATNAQSDATIAKQTASEATVQASNAESDFAQISIRANKIEANVANNSGAIASVQQTANGLTTTVADIKANGGGVNLANGTKSDDQSYGNASQTTGWRTPTIATFDNPQAGQQYTISVNTKTNGGSWRIQIWDGTSPTQRGKEVYGEPPVVAQEQKHTVTITWPSGSNKYLLVQLVNNNDGGQVFWNSAMIEEGTVAHTYSPAPGDLQNQFTQTKTSIDGINTIINDPKTGINATYQTAAGNATTISNVKSDVAQLSIRANKIEANVADNSGNISKIQETATQIQQAVSDNAGNITTAKQTADSAVAVASDAKSNATVAVQTASGASLTATNAQSDATTAMVTASGAITQASDAKSNATIAVQTASEASVTATNAQGDASVAKQTASDASVQIKNAQGDISNLQTRAGKIEASVATNSGAIANIQVTANELKASVSDNSGNITTAKQTADSAVTVASDARSNATVAIQTASQASITASSASGQAASAVLTANGAMATASNAKSDATVAVQTASGASLTATNAQSDATIAKQTASEATVQAANAESDFAQLSIRANKIEANVATNSGAIASVQQTANGLTTTVANIKANGGGMNLAKGTKSDDQSYGDASQTTGWRTPTIATFDNPQAGQQYTISVNTKSNGGSWRIQVWDGTSPTQRGNEIYGAPPVVAQEQKHTVTITWPSGSNKYLLVQLVNNNDGGQVFWNSAMIEEGTVAHTWSPAPGDLQNQFTQTKTSIDGINTIINDPKTGMTATYQTASQASLTAQNASGQAVTAVTTAQGAVTTANNAQSDAVVAKQTASEASVTASNAAGDASVAKQTASQASVSVQNAQSDITSLDARADSLEAFQKDASGNINKIVSRADGVDQTLTSQKGDITSLQSRADKLESSMSTANGQISTLQQTANGLTTTVADIKANGGGVNLAHNTSNAYVIPGDSGGSKNIGSLSTDEWVALAGKTITIGVTIEWTNWQTSGNNRIGFEVAPAKNGTGYWNNAFSLWCHPVNGSSGKQRLTATRTINNDIDGVVGGLAYVQGICGTAKISKLMIERGSVAHDWSPSPDDLQNQFTQTKASIDGITTTINDPKTGLNATYQTAAGNTTTISNVKGDVSQLQATANGLTSRVGSLESKTNSQQTTIDQNKAAIALKADQTTVNTLKGTVDQNTATLQTQAGQIQSKVSASDVTGMLTGYATQSYTQSLVTQKADDWNLNLIKLQTDVNAIKTTGGGVNLLLGTSGALQTVTNASGWNTSLPSYTATATTVSRDTAYTAKGWIAPASYDASLQIVWQDSSGTTHYTNGSTVSAGSSGYSTWTGTITSGGTIKYVTVAFTAQQSTSSSVSYKEVELEEGTVAHTWSPAPSDMATVTSVTNLSATVDGIKSTVATKADQSSVTQLSNAIQSKVSSSDYTSTISQLNNAINQRVQVGNVISQINQEAGGNTLIQVSNGSGSLILDAGNTIITGKAWIPSAAIANLTADQVQAGTLSGSTVHAGDNSGNAIDMGVLSTDYVGFHSYATNGDNTYIDLDGIHNYGASYDTRIQQGKITTNYLAVNGGGMIDFRDSNGTGMVAQGSALTFDVRNISAGYLSYSGVPIADWPSGSVGNEFKINYANSLAIINTSDTDSRALFSTVNTQIGYYQQGDTPSNWGLTGLEIDNTDRQINLGVYGSDGKWSRLLASSGSVELNASDNNGDAHCHLDSSRLHFYKDNDNNNAMAVELQVDGWAWVRGWVEAAGHSQHSTLSSKTRIEEADPDYMLDLVNNTELTTFAFKSEVAEGTEFRHIGPIIDDVNDVAQYRTPAEFIAPTKTARDDDNMIGALFGAVQALTKRIEVLEEKAK